MNAKFPTTGMTLQCSQISDFAFEVRQKNGFLLRFVTSSSRRHRKLGLESGRCSRRNLQPRLTISSSSTGLPIWPTDTDRTPGNSSPSWRNFLTFSMKTMLHTKSSQTAQLNFRPATSWRMPSPNMPAIPSKHTTSFCLLKSSKPVLRKMFANYCPTKTKLGSPSMMPTKCSSLNIGLNRINASPPPSISML